LPVRTSVPRPVFVRLPPAPPVIAPLILPSISALPLSVCIVRATVPISIGFWKSTVWVAVFAPRINILPFKPVFAVAQVMEPDAPPRFTMRSAPYAAQPPAVALKLTPVTVPAVARLRVKLPAPKPRTPPLKVRALVPPETPIPPGRAVVLPSTKAPPLIVVTPV